MQLEPTSGSQDDSAPRCDAMGRAAAWSGLVIAAGALLACSAPAGEPGGTEAEARPEDPGRPRVVREIEGEPLFRVLPQDAIPALDEPRFVSAEEAREFMLPQEPVLGVIGARGTPRAYSAWVLDRHEIVNDLLDGQPLMATW